MNERAEQDDPLLGQLVSDRYRVLRKIGEGGMGTVYEAIHVSIEKRVALKVLRSEYSASPTVVARFKQEAISASRIKHHNVIDVFDFGQLTDGSCFIAMEYLEGKDLGDLLHAGRNFTPPRAVAIAVSVCRALALAHARGVVHRDLKPENVFLQVTPEGEESIKIVDFGIAQLRKPDDVAPAPGRRRRLTKTGMIFGTPEYMAPEQARGHAVDERSDIYAIGVILYELVTGAVPFVGESFLEVLNAHNTLAVPPLSAVNPQVSVSPQLRHAIERALEKEADDRFQSMSDFAQALQACPEWRGSTGDIHLPSEPEFEAAQKDPVRLENSSFPAPSKETAQFGSPLALLRDEGESGVDPVKKRGIWVGAVGAVLMMGGAVFLVSPAGKQLRASSASAAPSEDGTPGSPEPSVRSTETHELVPREAGSESPAQEQVVLSIVTEPGGAVVTLDGFQVCDATPCDVLVIASKAVVLSASKGASRGESKVMAQRSQTVTIPLQEPPRSKPAAPPRPRVQPTPKPSRAADTLCEVLVDGIKILRPCP